TTSDRAPTRTTAPISFPVASCGVTPSRLQRDHRAAWDGWSEYRPSTRWDRGRDSRRVRQGIAAGMATRGCRADLASQLDRRRKVLGGPRRDTDRKRRMNPPSMLRYPLAADGIRALR